MPTIAQKMTFDEVMSQIGRGERPNIRKAARKVGYSPNTYTKPKNITASKGWKELLATVDDTVLLEKVREIALSDDKNAALKAVDMIMKLKDRYPAGKLKVQEYDAELSKLTD